MAPDPPRSDDADADPEAKTPGNSGTPPPPGDRSTAPSQPNQQGPSEQSWQPEPSGRRNRYWAIVALSSVLVVLIAVGIWGFFKYWLERQAGEIRTTIRDFALASDTADTAAMTALMCRAEAEEFRDGFEGVGDGEPIIPATRRPVDIGMIDVDGNDATAQVTRPPMPTVTLVLQREDGRWTMCNPG